MKTRIRANGTQDRRNFLETYPVEKAAEVTARVLDGMSNDELGTTGAMTPIRAKVRLTFGL